MKAKTYKVVVHFNRQRQDWTVHYRGQCIPAKMVVFHVWCRTVFKPEKKSNPRAWMEAYGIIETTREGLVAVRPAQ